MLTAAQRPSGDAAIVRGHALARINNPVSIPMKTNPSRKIFQFSSLIFLAIAVAAALVTQSIRASTVVFTEQDSSTLTVTLDGTPVFATNTGPDSWQITFFAVLDDALGVAWAEPENPTSDPNAVNGWNAITGFQIHSVFGRPTFTTISIQSDLTFASASAYKSNGGSFTNGSTSYQFTDLSDAAVSTPDTGSTLVLLSLAVTGLFGASRVRSFRFAY